MFHFFHVTGKLYFLFNTLKYYDFADWVYNDSMFKNASGFHRKHIKVEGICCENPDGKLNLL